MFFKSLIPLYRVKKQQIAYTTVSVNIYPENDIEILDISVTLLVSTVSTVSTVIAL